MQLPFRNPVVYAILTAVFFGSGAPFAKALLGSVPPMMLSFLIYLGSGLGLGAYLLLRRLFGSVRSKEESTLRKADLKWLAGVIIFGGFLAPLVLMTSLVQTPSATAALLLNF